MDVLTVGLARLVPLLFLASLTLVGTRYVYDVVLQRSPRLAKWAAAGVALMGIAAAGPFAIRGTFRTLGRYDVQKHRWGNAEFDFAMYDAWHGTATEKVLREWSYARMQLGRYAEAREILERFPSPPAQVKLEIAMCAYYSGDPSAEQLLAAVPEDPSAQLVLREYLRGRIAQRRGAMLDAVRWYHRAFSYAPGFFPATYHGVRIALLAHRPELATRILDDFVASSAYLAKSVEVQQLRRDIAQGTIPPDTEFHVVTN